MKLFRTVIFLRMLSRRNQTLVLSLSIIILATASIHIGELWLKWRMGEYWTFFSLYWDNVSGKRFHSQMCQHMPIDVVYTWSNGSDPRRLEELRVVLETVTQKISTGIGDVRIPPSQFKCSFKNCVPSEFLVVSPALPPHNDIRELSQVWPGVEEAVDWEIASVEENNISIFRFPTVDVAERLSKGLDTFYVHGKQRSVHRGFWTSDHNVPFAQLSSSIVLASSVPKEILQSKNITTSLLPQAVLASVVSIIPHLKSEVAVITFADEGSTETLLSRIHNRPSNALSVGFHRAYLLLRNSMFVASFADVKAKRFRDNYELSYSLRSLEMHAPWVRHVYLVTAGQIPHWLNLDAPRLTVLSHEDIFPNKSHLPTFSSSAIEVHLHKIPGLSKKFLYMNNDFFFGQTVWPDDFYSEIHGQKVYLSSTVVQCDPGCPEALIQNGHCDFACNISACQFDGGDCKIEDAHGDFTGRNFRSRSLKAAFDDSVMHVQNLFNVAYGLEARRFLAHTPYLIDRNILGKLQSKYPKEFEETSSHQLRTGRDMQLSFSYYYYLMSERQVFDPEKIFDEFDTDKSGTWSDREIRTLLTRLNKLPLRLETWDLFEQDLKNCAAKLPKEYSKGVCTPSYERSVNSTLPVISKQLIAACDGIVSRLKKNFGDRKKFKFQVANDSSFHFKALVSHVSQVLYQLDDVRKNPRKFLCVNDDMDDDSPENEIVANYLVDFFESLYPMRSSFELLDDEANPFLRTKELTEWRRRRRTVRIVTYCCFLVLVLFTLASFSHLQMTRWSMKIFVFVVVLGVGCYFCAAFW
jgi:hypothetical protein